MTSQAKGHKGVKHADWFFTFFPFYKTGVLPSVNAALWAIRPPRPCCQGKYVRLVGRVGVGLHNLLNEFRVV